MAKNNFGPNLYTAFFNDLTDECIDKFLSFLSGHGYAGICIEGKSRTPVTDVNSWFSDFRKLISKTIDIADKYGMDIWLVNDWGYPSGTAAGLVISADEDNRSKLLKISYDAILEPGECVKIPVNEKRFVSAAMWECGRYSEGPVGDAAVIALKNEEGYVCARNGENTSRVVVVEWIYNSSATHGIFADDPNKSQYGTIDLLNEKTVDTFIEIMYEPYFKDFPEKFGKGFKGFFYDEPHINFPFPYTSGIFEEFEKQMGYSIVPYLPQMLALLGPDEKLTDYRTVVCQLMAKNFIRKMNLWCQSHGVTQVGHQDIDHDIRGLSTISGDFFLNSKESMMPGIDYIWYQIDQNRFCDHPRFAGSAAHLYGKEHAMSESFAVVSRSLSTNLQRFAMDHQIIRGIDTFYNMYAEPDTSKETEATILSMSNPQNRLFGAKINERMAKVNSLVNSLTPSASVGIYVSTMQSYIDKVKASLPWTVSTRPWMSDKIDDIAKAVCYAPCDYEYIWDDAILSLDISGGLVTPKGQRLSVLVFPSRAVVSFEVAKKLIRFMNDGGKVICVGGKIFGLGKAEEQVILLKNEYELCRWLYENKYTDTIKADGRVSLCVRNDDEYKYYFCLNESAEPAEANISGLMRTSDIEEYDFQSYCFEKLSKLEYRAHKPQVDCIENTGIVSFVDGEMRIFRVRKNASKGLSDKTFDELWQDTLRFVLETEKGAIDVGAGCDWREYVEPCFSGTLTYKSEFKVPAEGEYLIDFGKVCHSAKVYVDDECFLLPFNPYSLKIKLSAGIHKLTAEVMNTGINEKIGTYEMELTEVNRRASWYEGDRFNLQSGLIGPVRIIGGIYGK